MELFRIVAVSLIVLASECANNKPKEVQWSDLKKVTCNSELSSSCVTCSEFNMIKSGGFEAFMPIYDSIYNDVIDLENANCREQALAMISFTFVYYRDSLDGYLAEGYGFYLAKAFESMPEALFHESFFNIQYISDYEAHLRTEYFYKDDPKMYVDSLKTELESEWEQRNDWPKFITTKYELLKSLNDFNFD